MPTLGGMEIFFKKFYLNFYLVFYIHNYNNFYSSFFYYYFKTWGKCKITLEFEEIPSTPVHSNCLWPELTLKK